LLHGFLPLRRGNRAAFEHTLFGVKPVQPGQITGQQRQRGIDHFFQHPPRIHRPQAIPALIQLCGDLLAELAQVDWLGEAIGRSSHQGLSARLRRILVAHQQNGDMARGGMGMKLLAGLNAVAHRHCDIHEHQVRLLPEGRRHRVQCAVNHRGLVSVPLQPDSQHLHGIRRVINNENLGAHTPIPVCGTVPSFYCSDKAGPMPMSASWRSSPTQRAPAPGRPSPACQATVFLRPQGPAPARRQRSR